MSLTHPKLTESSTVEEKKGDYAREVVAKIVVVFLLSMPVWLPVMVSALAILVYRDVTGASCGG